MSSAWADVLVLCEGETERDFCNQPLKRVLEASFVQIRGTLVGRPDRKRGGVRPWQVYERELNRLATERADRYVGLLVDYYAMPDNWPGRAEAARLGNATERGEHVERALREALHDTLGDRFLPCVQFHEFESLLFVDPDTTAQSIAVSAVRESYLYRAPALHAIREQFRGNVELINDSEETAPSKRLMHIFPDYNKRVWGPQVVADVGIETLVENVPWLRRWLNALRDLGNPNAV